MAPLPRDLAPPFALFAAPDGRPGRDALLFRNAVELIRADELSQVAPAIDAVARGGARGLHAVGFVSYDAAPAFDSALAVRGRGATPLVWFGLFRDPEAVTLDTPQKSAPPSVAWRADVERANYDSAVQRIRSAIEQGDVYQVNHTLRFKGRAAGDSLALFQQLWAAQESSLAAYFDLGPVRILSASPELFFQLAGRNITTRPMKGTAPRGRWLAEDDARAAQLAASEKERAENVMIVDLLRNDLGRIATTGTVRVDRLFDVERYPTVLQLTSTISAELAAGTSLREVFTALFPCGSVTGAPKVAATRLIAELESSPRGVYCGAIGRVEPTGTATFNVAIRTLVVDAKTGDAEYGAGGGITWDSAPHAEYDEVRTKAAILTAQRPEFSLLETLRLESGTYTHLVRHLARLTESARYFAFHPASHAEAAANAALTAHAREHAGCVGARRVRLLFDRDGAAHVESTPLDTDGARTMHVALARSPISRRDVFLYHKTTNRGVYERLRAEHAELDEVLLWNEEGELTEFTIGNLVVELDGQRFTPPRDCGLLAGVFRAELLETGAIAERVVHAEDLARASAIWLVNGVRGWVPVEFIQD